MKNFCLMILLLLFSFSAAYADEADVAKEGKNIVFIYMNGSNTNCEKSKNGFLEDVQEFHPFLKSAFESNEYAVKHFLKGNKFSISPEPVAFYWGDKSQSEVGRLDKELLISSIFSPKIAQSIRAFFAHCMHDAIWVQKPYNMSMIASDLHEKIKHERAAGNSVVLLGYSAGSFITYQYIFNKFPYVVDPGTIFLNSNISEESKEFIKNTKVNPTCIEALVDSNLVVVSANGRVVPVENEKMLKEKYLSLDKQTECSCASSDDIRGIINFGSPLVLFYSDISSNDFDLSVYNKLLYEYIIEHDFFWITTNYREDPLGFPTATNLDVDGISKILGLEISPRQGFLFDRSDLKSRRTFMGAHLSYWKNAKKLSKDMVKTYEIGRRYYYGEE